MFLPLLDGIQRKSGSFTAPLGSPIFTDILLRTFARVMFLIILVGKSSEFIQTQETQLAEQLKIHLAWHISLCTKTLHKPSFFRGRHAAMKSELLFCVTVGPKMKSIPVCGILGSSQEYNCKISNKKVSGCQSTFYPWHRHLGGTQVLEHLFRDH